MNNMGNRRPPQNRGPNMGGPGQMHQGNRPQPHHMGGGGGYNNNMMGGGGYPNNQG